MFPCISLIFLNPPYKSFFLNSFLCPGFSSFFSACSHIFFHVSGRTERPADLLISIPPSKYRKLLRDEHSWTGPIVWSITLKSKLGGSSYYTQDNPSVTLETFSVLCSLDCEVARWRFVFYKQCEIRDLEKGITA